MDDAERQAEPRARSWQDPQPQRSNAHDQPPITIVTHEAGRAELPWIRYLLGVEHGEVVEDADRVIVPARGVVVSDDPDAFAPEVRARIRRSGQVGLVHVGDDRYRSRSSTYADFRFVWRTYLHSSLAGLDVRQIPLGPSISGQVGAEPSSGAARSPGERPYIWSHPGVPSSMSGTCAFMEEALAGVEGEARTGYEWSDDAAVLAGSVFAPCPMVGRNLESHRIYDALELGAVPIVERRRWLDYFSNLFGDHPLPAVSRWGEAPSLMGDLLSRPAALARLQREVVAWWSAEKESLASAARKDVASKLAGGPDRWEGPPLDRPPPRWRGVLESLRHQNRLTVRQR